LNTRKRKPKPGERVILTELPPGFLDDLPAEDQLAISKVVGKPIKLLAYDTDGRAELEFEDANGVFHAICVKPSFVKLPGKSRRAESG
jgi:hypothetical protein